MFTKAAIKLHNWPGPPGLPTHIIPEEEGMFTPYQVKEEVMPEFCKAYMPCFPNWSNLIDFIYKVGDAGIAYSIWRVGGPEHIIGAVLPDNKKIKELHDSGVVQEAADAVIHPCIVVLFGNTKGEFEYQTRVFEDIMHEMGGSIPAVMEKGFMKGIMELLNIHFLVANDSHLVGHSGGFIINAAYTATHEATFKHQGIGGEELKKKYIESGAILDDGLDSMYHNSFDNNSYVYSEVEYHYDASDRTNCEEALGVIVEEVVQRTMEQKAPISASNFMVTPLVVEPAMDWQNKIKSTFDPNDLSGSGYYGKGLIGKMMAAFGL